MAIGPLSRPFFLGVHSMKRNEDILFEEFQDYQQPGKNSCGQFSAQETDAAQDGKLTPSQVFSTLNRLQSRDRYSQLDPESPLLHLSYEHIGPKPISLPWNQERQGTNRSEKPKQEPVLPHTFQDQ